MLTLIIISRCLISASILYIFGRLKGEDASQSSEKYANLVKRTVHNEYMHHNMHYYLLWWLCCVKYYVNSP